MNLIKYLKFLLLLQVVVTVFIANSASADIKESVIKIYCTSQSYFFDSPWKKTNISSGIGSGFLIKGDRILTNAHVVSNARYIEVQTYLHSTKYIAEVEFISHSSDLAILKVKNKEFYKGLVPLEFGPLPKINSEVTTYGYPVGGAQLSVTRGIVSRIEMTLYSHSGIEEHLTIQTDAAINPGNSGGPVIQDEKVIGVAFQGLAQADNVGYMIPIVVVNQLLTDIEDGKLDGFSQLGVEYDLYCQNPHFRKLISLPNNLGGVVITAVNCNSIAQKKILRMDVILSIEGHKITNDGFVFLKDQKVNFLEVVERLQIGSQLNLQVWRDGKRKSIKIKTAKITMPIPQNYLYDIAPKYYIFGGLAFTTFSNEYLNSIGGWNKVSLTLKQLFIEGNSNEKYLDFKEFCVLTKILPARLNVNMAKHVGNIVKSVNGVVIKSIAELKNQIISSTQDLIEIRFLGGNIPLVISKKDAIKESSKILKEYHINNKERL